MPNRSSSGSSKGRGRPSRRPRGDGNFKHKRTDDNRGDDSGREGGHYSKRGNRSTGHNRFSDREQSSDRRGGHKPFSKNTDRQNRSDKFSSRGDKNENRNEKGSSYSKNASRQTRSGRFADGVPKKTWRKSFTDESGSDRSEFKNRKNTGDSFGSDKPHFEGKDRYPKFDKGHFRKRASASKESEKQTNAEEPAATGKIRLNKFIANSGVCSRREADELIKMGLISVNGVTITELGYKVNPDDEVRHDGKLLRREKPVYILMNKPKGFLTTTSDPEDRNTVMHLIANHIKERVYPVGRLDRNTTGLLLLTNDGDLAEKLMHPSYNVKKIYKVELDRPLTKGDAQKIVDGVKLEEGVAIVDDLAIVSEDRRTVGLEIHIGWNRVVRRIFEALEYEVVKLDRSVYAGLTKKDLARGEWRFLKKEELVILKHLQ